MLATYSGLILLLAAAVIAGQGVLLLAGLERQSWLGPAIGLAALEVVSAIAIKLPGRGTTAAVIVLILLLATIVWLVRERRFTVPLAALAVVILPILAYSIPFVANARVGLPGVSLDNDTASHLLWAQTLLTPRPSLTYFGTQGYPLGPHSIAATLSWATGIRLDLAFTSLLLVVAPLSALAAASVLPRSALWRRLLIGLLTSTGYLIAAYYGEGAFKEIMMGLYLLTFTLYLRHLTLPGNAPQTRVAWARAGVPLGLLLAAAVYTYSYLALGWLGGTLAVWAVLLVLRTPLVALERVRGYAQLLPVALTAAVSLVLCAVVLAPYFHGLESQSSVFGLNPASSPGGNGISVSNIGNLAGPLSGYEALGIWLRADFRFEPSNLFRTGQLSLFALVVLLFGIVWHLRRRDLLLVAAAIACGLIYWRSKDTQSAYVTAKALVIATPIVMLIGSRALLGGETSGLSPLWSATMLVVGLIFAGLALDSSSQALRAEPIDSQAQITQLASLGAVVGNKPTLFLGNDDYAQWELGARNVSYISVESPPPPIITAQSSKPWVYGDAFDFDSVTSSELNHFSYVITANTPYASQAPASFTLLRVLPQYELWQRTGSTGQRENIDSAGAPGAALDCKTKAGAKLSRTPGEAAVTTAPVVTPGVPAMVPNTVTNVGLALPAGRWALSLEYFSNEHLQISAQGARWHLPAYLGRPGPYFYFGSVSSTGPRHPIVVSIYEDHPSRLTSPNDIATLAAIAATSIPNTRQLVPLSSACGRYVDWYQTR